MKNFTSIKTCNDIISSLDGIVKLMREANNQGLASFSVGITNINLVDFFKAFEMLRRMHGDNVRLYELGSVFNDECHEIRIRIATGYYVSIQSEKVSKLIPKINLINYN